MDDKNKKVRLTHSEDYYVKILLNKVKLKEVMTPSPLSVREDAPFSQVVDRMTQHDIRHVPIVDKYDHLVGLMTQRDLYKIQPPHRNMEGLWVYDKDFLNSIILSSVMIKDPFTMRTDNTVAEAIINMVQFKYGCILIVDDQGVLLGIITQLDILKIAAQIIQES
ncbi:MAG: hypothetical protein A2Z88_01780 [Omnitrophica WOR_2 bacterium GWA2_47_8]|nr:MAG: hypothetical protein A2Z88_01780 [Omnitrophica WOR_2 bacterium GWA2_47_8]